MKQLHPVLYPAISFFGEKVPVKVLRDGAVVETSIVAAKREASLAIAADVVADRG